MTENFYYNIDDENFGINFPLGIKAEIIADYLKEANKQLI